MMHTVKWKQIIDSSGPQPRPRHGHRAFAFKEYMVVFGGGSVRIENDLHVYDTLKNQWLYPQVNGDIHPGSAVCGIAVCNNRVLVFGGMREQWVVTKTLYELRVESDLWTWTRLAPKSTSYARPPCSRFGHSFTTIGNTVYLFGGMTNRPAKGSSTNSRDYYYFNDLYILHLPENDTPAWEKPKIYGKAPHPRESHSAVAHTDSEGNSRLIVYGGMSERRLGDLWILDIGSMTWRESVIHDPFPRSLHSATVVDNKMYIFGGWVKNGRKARCSGKLLCMNLETLDWIKLSVNSDDVPNPRAGHCAVALHGRIYMWSGRSYCPRNCLKDLWCLEIDCPQSVNILKASIDGAEV